MKRGEFNWGAGRVTHWDMEEFDSKVHLEKQLGLLKEDLVQVEFGKETILDIGWYPEFTKEGSFVVVVIRNSDWDNPLIKRKAGDIGSLKAAIDEGVSIASASLEL